MLLDRCVVELGPGERFVGPERRGMMPPGRSEESVAVDVDEVLERGTARVVIEEAVEKKKQKEAQSKDAATKNDDGSPDLFERKADEIERLDEESQGTGMRSLDVDLSAIGAVDAVQLLRETQVTPERLLRVVEWRRDLVDGVVHSTPIVDFFRARRELELAPQCYDLVDGHLAGLPVLAKGLHAVRGLPHPRGSKVYENVVADASCVLVQQVEKLGGIVYGTSNVPEFGAGAQCFNDLFETTANPYDTRLTSGGSSGGAAAALATRQCWLALGSDLGGSLRTPAAFCGVCGFRVTPGRISRDQVYYDKVIDDASASSSPHHPPTTIRAFEPVRRYDLHSIDGPMARDVAGLGLFMDCLTYPRHCATLGWRGLYEKQAEESSPYLDLGNTFHALAVRGARSLTAVPLVAVSKLGSPVANDVWDLIVKAADKLKAYNEPRLVQVDAPWPLDVAEDCFHALRACAMHEKYGGLPPEDFDKLKPEIQWNVRAAVSLRRVSERDDDDANDSSSSDLLATFYERAVGLNRDVVAPAVKKFFDRFDVLVAPAALDLPFDKRVRYPTGAYGDASTHSGFFKDYVSWLKPTAVVSVTECPALVLPCGAVDGLPVGVQLITRPGDDEMLLELAASLETQLELPFRHGIAVPVQDRTGPTRGTGPRTADEARAHHAARAPLSLPDFDNTPATAV